MISTSKIKTLYLDEGPHSKKIFLRLQKERLQKEWRFFPDFAFHLWSRHVVSFLRMICEPPRSGGSKSHLCLNGVHPWATIKSGWLDPWSFLAAKKWNFTTFFFSQSPKIGTPKQNLISGGNLRDMAVLLVGPHEYLGPFAFETRKKHQECRHLDRGTRDRCNSWSLSFLRIQT